MKDFFKQNPSLSFLLIFLVICWIFYILIGAKFGIFAGAFLATSFDPLVIAGAVISVFLGRTYLHFILWSFGIGFSVSLVELILFGPSSVFPVQLIVIPVLANAINAARAVFGAGTKPKKQA